MSTKAIREALTEYIERDEDYAEECERAGRRDEARSVRRRIARAQKALDAVTGIEDDCIALHMLGTEGAGDALHRLHLLGHEANERRTGGAETQS